MMVSEVFLFSMEPLLACTYCGNSREEVRFGYVNSLIAIYVKREVNNGSKKKGMMGKLVASMWRLEFVVTFFGCGSIFERVGGLGKKELKLFS